MKVSCQAHTVVGLVGHLYVRQCRKHAVLESNFHPRSGLRPQQRCERHGLCRRQVRKVVQGYLGGLRNAVCCKHVCLIASEMRHRGAACHVQHEPL